MTNLFCVLYRHKVVQKDFNIIKGPAKTFIYTKQFFKYVFFFQVFRCHKHHIKNVLQSFAFFLRCHINFFEIQWALLDFRAYY
jgi:hypothetical protein